MIELIVFVVAGGACLAGAVGVVASRNPVHSALSLVGTLFGIAVLFIAQEANFLAAVQVIVYAGAIVVLFLFVIMLLGVDRLDDLKVEPLVGQRVAAALIGVAVFALPVAAMASTDFTATGVTGGLDADVPDIEQLGQSLFTRYLFAFEITSLLLVIAVVGAVALGRRIHGREIVDASWAEEEERIAERLARAEARAHPDEHGAAVVEADGEVIEAEVEPAVEADVEEVRP
ncbi:MAG TPA: NADH-quinone oxidoreductase subunit J [Acidimicrobiales bacterium]